MKELPAAAQDVNGVGRQVHIQAELHVAACAGFLSHHLINGVHQVNCASEALALRIGHLSIEQRVGHSIEGGADGQSSVVVGLLGDKCASGRGVITANEAVDQTHLLRAQLCIGSPQLQSFAFWLLGSGRLLIRLWLGKRQFPRDKREKDEKEQSGHSFHRGPPREKARIERLES